MVLALKFPEATPARPPHVAGGHGAALMAVAAKGAWLWLGTATSCSDDPPAAGPLHVSPATASPVYEVVAPATSVDAGAMHVPVAAATSAVLKLEPWATAVPEQALVSRAGCVPGCGNCCEGAACCHAQGAAAAQR